VGPLLQGVFMEQTSLYEVLNRVRKIDFKIKTLTIKKLSTPTDLLDLRKKVALEKKELEKKELESKSFIKKKDHLKILIEKEKEKLEILEKKQKEVKNNVAYQATVKELSNFKKNIKNFEKEILEIEKKENEFKEEIKQIESKYKEILLSYENSLVNFKDRSNSIERDLNDIKQEKNKILKELPKDILNKYIKVYENKAGTGISIVNENRCSACNMILPKQFCNQIIKNDSVYHCPSCQRLIISVKE
jgi:uncharacterized protein